jgi:hypothetical protein
MPSYFYYIKKGLFYIIIITVGIYRQKLRNYISLVNHSYSDLSAPYLSTAIHNPLLFIPIKQQTNPQLIGHLNTLIVNPIITLSNY